MAINEVVTGSGESTEASPTSSMSEFLIDKPSGGNVTLQYKPASWTTWRDIEGTNGPVPTPDLTAVYRFKYNGVTNTNVFFGP